MSKSCMSNPWAACRLERLEKSRFKTAEEKAAGALETEALNRIQAALESSKPARSVPLRSGLPQLTFQLALR